LRRLGPARIDLAQLSGKKRKKYGVIAHRPEFLAAGLILIKASV
jgi:hypothetical protein